MQLVLAAALRSRRSRAALRPPPSRCRLRRDGVLERRASRGPCRARASSASTRGAPDRAAARSASRRGSSACMRARHRRVEQVVGAAVEIEARLALRGRSARDTRPRRARSSGRSSALPCAAAAITPRMLRQVVVQRARAALLRADDHRVRAAPAPAACAGAIRRAGRSRAGRTAAACGSGRVHRSVRRAGPAQAGFARASCASAGRGP